MHFFLDQQTTTLNNLKMSRRRLAEVRECRKVSLSQGLSHSPAHSRFAGNFATLPLISTTKAQLHQPGNPALEASGHNLSFVGQE